MASRTQSKAEAAIESLQKENSKADLHFQKLDLDDLQSVREAVKSIKTKEERVDILVCNAGIMAAPYALTKDGFEVQFQSNHLGHFLFVTGLKELLENGARASGHPSRVVNLSSIGHRFGGFTTLDFTSKEAVNRKFGPIPFLDTYIRYGQAKASNILFAREINKRWDPKLVRALAVHPGVVGTELYKHSVISPIAKYIMINTQEGALSSLKSATDPEIEKEGSWDQLRGTYGENMSQAAFTKSEKYQEELWNLSEALTRKA